MRGGMLSWVYPAQDSPGTGIVCRGRAEGFRGRGIKFAGAEQKVGGGGALSMP